MRIFRFAADSAPRVLQITHVSEFLRECAVEFGSADATLPGALRIDYASGLFFWLRDVVESNATRCPWLAAKLLACRSGAPVPAAALAPDVTRHDVDWGAEGARRHADLQLTHGGYGVLNAVGGSVWAQGAVGVTSGKHWFSVSITRSTFSYVRVGWLDRALRCDDCREEGPGSTHSSASGATFMPAGYFYFGTAPPSSDQSTRVAEAKCPCTVGCLLDADAGAMTVFVDGELLAQQCDYRFPADGREWAPSVGLGWKDALFSNAV
jgi:hypothetical protein